MALVASIDHGMRRAQADHLALHEECMLEYAASRGSGWLSA